MRIIILLLAAAVLYSCGHPSGKKELLLQQTGIQTKVETFPVANGYGYAIMVNNKPFIRQENIPVLQGKRTLKTAQDAQKVGRWVASRIQHHQQFSLTLPALQNLIDTADMQLTNY